jgi:hypothetical protein
LPNGGGAGPAPANPIDKPRLPFAEEAQFGDETPGDTDGSSDDTVSANIFTSGLYALFKHLFKSCDGPLVLGQTTFDGQQ